MKPGYRDWLIYIAFLLDMWFVCCCSFSTGELDVNHDDTNMTNKQENCALTCQCSCTLCWRCSGSWWSRCHWCRVRCFTIVFVVRLYSVIVNVNLLPNYCTLLHRENGSFEVLCLHSLPLLEWTCSLSGISAVYPLRPQLATQIGHQLLRGTCVALCAVLAASVGGSGVRIPLAGFASLEKIELSSLIRIGDCSSVTSWSFSRFISLVSTVVVDFFIHVVYGTLSTNHHFCKEEFHSSKWCASRNDHRLRPNSLSRFEEWCDHNRDWRCLSRHDVSVQKRQMWSGSKIRFPLFVITCPYILSVVLQCHVIVRCHSFNVCGTHHWKLRCKPGWADMTKTSRIDPQFVLLSFPLLSQIGTKLIFPIHRVPTILAVFQWNIQSPSFAHLIVFTWDKFGNCADVFELEF